MNERGRTVGASADARRRRRHARAGSRAQAQAESHRVGLRDHSCGGHQLEVDVVVVFVALRAALRAGLGDDLGDDLDHLLVVAVDDRRVLLEVHRQRSENARFSARILVTTIWRRAHCARGVIATIDCIQSRVQGSS